MFAVGYGLQLCLKVLLQLKRLIRQPTRLRRLPFELDTMALGAFLSTFSILFRGVSCILRKAEGKDSQAIALPAGFIAGLSFFFYRGNTIALYFMWKTFQVLYNKGVDAGRLKRVPWASVFFHAFSTAVLFHCAIVEPHNLRPSYWKFLIAVSGGRLVCFVVMRLNP
ncbi:hypothetical protein AAG570_002695 [Ranatra chinensis]|uniref:Uncharacterized protein n=1 Tax=Ranatra chinensis TaxID=642074 RepID=A0ABD0YAD2_9HEMI